MTISVSQHPIFILNSDHSLIQPHKKAEEMQRIFWEVILNVDFPDKPTAINYATCDYKHFCFLAPFTKGANLNSHVYKIEIKDGDFALKRCPEKSKKDAFLSECKILKALNQKEKELEKEYIVKLMAAYGKGSKVLMLFPLYEMDLRKFVKNKCLSLPDARICMQSLLEALEFLKTNKVLHLDIKPENVFLTSSGALRLGDFGVARKKEEGGGFCGTLNFISPEFLIASRYADYACDIWSLAITIHNVFTRDNLIKVLSISERPKIITTYPNILSQCYPPELREEVNSQGFDLSEVPEGSLNQAMENLESVFEKSGEADGELFDRFKSLLNEMLQLDPSKRITVEEALEKIQEPIH